MKPYKYRNIQIARPEFNIHGVSRVGVKEQLTGQIQGQKASDLEERQANSYDALKVGYTFRARITSMISGSRRLTKTFANLPGEVEIDLLLDYSPVIPVFIDGQISHFQTYWQREEDAEKTRVVNEFGSGMGWREAVRVPFVDILNKEASDQV